VLGNALEGGWLGARTGRLPEARERVRERGGGARLRDAAVKGETPDETLSREEAVRQARLEQQREPPDLIGWPPSLRGNPVALHRVDVQQLRVVCGGAATWGAVRHR